MCQETAALWKPVSQELEMLGVRLIGVGMGTMSLKFWVDENVFPGELFVDQDNKIHKAMELESASLLAGFSKDVRTIYSNGPERGFKGEFTDLSIGLQLGGVWVVEKGEVLLEQPQKTLVENGNVEEVMSFLRSHQ